MILCGVVVSVPDFHFRGPWFDFVEFLLGMWVLERDSHSLVRRIDITSREIRSRKLKTMFRYNTLAEGTLALSTGNNRFSRSWVFIWCCKAMHLIQGTPDSSISSMLK